MLTEAIFERACMLHREKFKQTKPNQVAFNRTVFAAAKLAADVSSCAGDNRPYLVQSDTGTGKTTFCISLMARCANELEAYSVAYVVGTILEAQKVCDDLRELVSEDDLAIFTSAHASERAALEYGEPIIKHVTERGTVTKDQLGKHRIVVCTHELWMREPELGKVNGVRQYKGKNRTNIFLDEFPNTVVVETVAPSDLVYLSEELGSRSGYEQHAAIVDKAAVRLRQQCGNRVSQFGLPRLLEANDYELVRDVDAKLPSLI